MFVRLMFSDCTPFQRPINSWTRKVSSFLLAVDKITNPASQVCRTLTVGRSTLSPQSPALEVEHLLALLYVPQPPLTSSLP